MDTKLSKVLKLIGDLSKQELMTLKQAVVSLIKTQRDVDFAKASIVFNKGDIVSYIDSSGIRVYGVVTKENPKTIMVTTENNYYVNIPASYLRLEEKPSLKLLDVRKKVAPTPEDIKEILEFESKKNPLH
jgi:hypothetical protein